MLVVLSVNLIEVILLLFFEETFKLVIKNLGNILSPAVGMVLW